MNLLVLDLDETLVHARETPLEREADFRAGEYYVYRRPGLAEFIEHAANRFRIGVWTSSGAQYAATLVSKIFPSHITIEFIYSRDRCTRRMNFETQEWVYVKRLAKLKKRYALENVLMIDDSPEKHPNNFGNLIRVTEYDGAAEDRELMILSRYLETLADCPNVRKIEKRHWRETARAAMVQDLRKRFDQEFADMQKPGFAEALDQIFEARGKRED